MDLCAGVRTGAFWTIRVMRQGASRSYSKRKLQREIEVEVFSFSSWLLACSFFKLFPRSTSVLHLCMPGGRIISSRVTIRWLARLGYAIAQ